MPTTNHRDSDYPIDPMFLERWSPRAFTDEAISQTDLMSMLEAARWAPSSGNMQPWRFVYALRDSAHWEKFVHLLVPNNQTWAKQAAALVVLVSKTTVRWPGSDHDVPSMTHSLDAGTASGFFSIQAHQMGWYVHGMGGFDRDRTLAELKIPQGYVPEAVYAVGRKGDPAKLPEGLAKREHPSGRTTLREMVFEGSFNVAEK